MYLEKLQARWPDRAGHRRRTGDRARLRRGARRGRRQGRHRRLRRRGRRERPRRMRTKGYDAEIAHRWTSPIRSGVTKVADDVVERHGKVDILVNNAGIARSRRRPRRSSDEHWLNVIDVNLNGALLVLPRLRQPHAARRSRGSIVNIGSMSGFIVNKPQEQAFYNASKAGVHHLTKSLAAEWGARGVRVNAVAPTYIDTPLNAFVKENPRDVRALDRRHADGPDGPGRRDRLGRPVPGLRRRQPDDRHDRPRRRRLYLLVLLGGTGDGGGPTRPGFGDVGAIMATTRRLRVSTACGDSEILSIREVTLTLRQRADRRGRRRRLARGLAGDA